MEGSGFCDSTNILLLRILGTTNVLQWEREASWVATVTLHACSALLLLSFSESSGPCRCHLTTKCHRRAYLLPGSALVLMGLLFSVTAPDLLGLPCVSHLQDPGAMPGCPGLHPAQFYPQ